MQLNLSGQLTITAGAQISSDTSGSGAGGNVTIAQSAVLDGAGLQQITAISTQTLNGAVFGGAGGNIVLNIRGTLQLLGGGNVTTSTFGSGASGSIDVHAARVFISGEGAMLFPGINASSLNQTVGGPSGDVRLTLISGLNAVLVAGGAISVSTAGPGAGGEREHRCAGDFHCRDGIEHHRGDVRSLERRSRGRKHCHHHQFLARQ